MVSNKHVISNNFYTSVKRKVRWGGLRVGLVDALLLISKSHSKLMVSLV